MDKPDETDANTELSRVPYMQSDTGERPSEVMFTDLQMHLRSASVSVVESIFGGPLSEKQREWVRRLFKRAESCDIEIIVAEAALILTHDQVSVEVRNVCFLAIVACDEAGVDSLTEEAAKDALKRAYSANIMTGLTLSNGLLSRMPAPEAKPEATPEAKPKKWWQIL